VEVIAQPKGVGVLTAFVFALTLEDKDRFRNSRTVGAYIGFNPKRDQSGDVDKQLGITKAGDAMIRRLAVGSANCILGPFGEDSDLRGDWSWPSAAGRTPRSAPRSRWREGSSS
jgi:transposase